MKSTRKAWLITGMLFLFMLINFLDKAVLGLSAVPIMTELHLSHTEFGAIASAFFYLFSLSAVFVGILAVRVKARWLLFGMALVWSACQLPLFGAVGAGVLLGCRILLGAGEGPAYPISVHAAYKWFADTRRLLPTAVISQGSNIGIVLVLPLLNLLLVRYSWHVACGVLGIVALAWAVGWYFVGEEGPLKDEGDARGTFERPPVPYTALLFNRTVLSSWCVSFGAYWSLSLVFSWFTPYLVEARGMSQGHAGLATTLPWIVSLVATLGGSWWSAALARRGASSRVSRGVLGGGFVAVGGAALILLPVAPAAWKLPLLVTGLALPSIIYIMGPAIAGEICPAGQRGFLLATGSAITTSAGLVAPVLMGHLVDHAADVGRGYEYGFFVNGLFALAGGLIFILFVAPEATARMLAEKAIEPAFAKPNSA